MRVLLVNQVFHPDVAATAQHAHDLARHLVRHGHEVNVVAPRSIYGQRGGPLPKREDVDGATVHRVGRSLFGTVGTAGRLVDFLADRYREIESGFEMTTWSTPLTGHTRFGGTELPSSGSAVWSLEDGDFEYIRVRVTDVHYSS